MRTRLMRTSFLTPMLLALLFVAAGNAFGQPIDPSSYYRITAKLSGKCLAVSGGNAFRTNGVPVIQWDCIDTENNQKWQVVPVGWGWYKIVAKHSGRALEIRGGVGAVNNQAAAQQWDYVGAANQYWWLTPVGDGFYQIVAAHSRKSLEVDGGRDATGNGAQVQQWDYWGGDNQKWKLTPIPDVVSGSFTYTDAEADPAGAGTFRRPIAGCRVEVLRGGTLAATTETNIDGNFIASVPHRPDGTDTRIAVYASNGAARVLSNFLPFSVTTAPQPSSGGNTLVFNQNFGAPNEVRSFNAAHDIRLAYNFAAARRDPRETDVIPVVNVVFNDIGLLMTHYDPPLGGLVLGREHNSMDLVIMHEYAHFLEDKIGSFLLLPSWHDGCNLTQRCPNPADCANGLLINSPENAWMEGFADYFAMAVKRANPTERFDLTSGGTQTEANLNNPGTCDAVGRAAYDGHTIDREMVEKFVASVLWKAGSPPGSDTEVFQIFDRELDGSATGLLPNIRSFRYAWRQRPGLNQARLDDIFREQIPALAAAAANNGAPAEVEACKNTLRSGTISWGQGTTWNSGNIDRLCNGSRNARNTISCFQLNVAAVNWSIATERCR
jgi:hypothetical protein